MLKDKIAVVTGAGSGIGEGIAEGFVRQGASVAVADIDVKQARRVARAIGRAARAVEVDVTDRNSTEAMVEQVEDTLGPIDVFVNNAGVSHIVPFLECTEQTWDRTIRVNLTGTFNGCQAAIGRMIHRKKGVLINMSSQSGKVGNVAYAAYCASKFGVIGLTQSLAAEFAREGIRVNALCPGVVFTPLWEGMIKDYAAKRGMEPDDVRPYYENKIPAGRLCSVEDVADAAVFLASDKSTYITGQAINLTGGMVMH